MNRMVDLRHSSAARHVDRGFVTCCFGWHLISLRCAPTTLSAPCRRAPRRRITPVRAPRRNILLTIVDAVTPIPDAAALAAANSANNYIVTITGHVLLTWSVTRHGWLARSIGSITRHGWLARHASIRRAPELSRAAGRAPELRCTAGRAPE